MRSQRASDMNRREMCARHYATGEPVHIRWQEGRIRAAVPTIAPAVEDLWVATAILELQINGFAGIDVQRDDLAEAELLQACAGLRASGCGQFLLTLMTDRWQSI